MDKYIVYTPSVVCLSSVICCVSHLSPLVTGSNNTAELTAIGEALIWLRDNARSLCSGFQLCERHMQQLLSVSQQVRQEEQASSMSTQPSATTAAVGSATVVPSTATAATASAV